MAWVLEHSPVDQPTHRLVLLSIANHANEHGARSWPSQATIAREAKVSKRTVQRAIQQLENDGDLIVHERGGGTARTQERYRTNGYTIVGVFSPGATQARPLNRSRGDNGDNKGHAGDQSGVTPVAHEPSVQPSGEPGVDFDAEAVA